MTAPITESQTQYLALLLRYVDDPQEQILADVQALGRAMFAAGVPTEELGAIHEYALEAVGEKMPELRFVDSARVSPMLVELLMMHGMAFREQAERQVRQEVQHTLQGQRQRQALLAHNEELERILKELASSNEDLEEFAYATSHDLQAPLRHVKGYLKKLSADNEDR